MTGRTVLGTSPPGGVGAPAGAARRTPVSWWIRRFATDTNSVVERQLCTAAVYVAAHAMFLVSGIVVTEPAAVLAGMVLVAAATMAAFVLRRPGYPGSAAMIVPLMDLLAVGLLRAGTGGAASVFTILLILPVISLGVEPGRWPLLWGGVVTVGVILLPAAMDPASATDGQWVRVIFTPLVLGLTCLSVNELTRRLRSRISAVKLLRAQQAVLLRQAQDSAATNAATSALLRQGAALTTAVIDAITEQAIVGTDLDGTIEVFNPGAERLLGVAAHDVLGRRTLVDFTLLEHAGPGQDAAAHEAVKALIAEAERGVPLVRSRSQVTADGRRRELDVSITARRDAAGDVDGFIFVATDMTEAKKQARLKDEFISLISHELRTPLSSILGYLELLADDDDKDARLTAEQHAHVATIQRNAHRLLSLVSDLLFTAQVESGRFRIERCELDLAAVVRASFDSARPAAKARGVRLALGDASEPMLVSGDALRLGQAVDNLVSNAVKFTPGGGRVAVTLGWGPADEEAPRALISVSDTGIGIPADQLDQLFGRFFRASTATQHAVPGVGLGLTIARAIATAHDGSIRVASTVGEGTTFTLALPRLP